jgi:hypothetical protein
LSVSILLPHLGIKWLEPGRENDGPYIDFNLLRRLIEIYGVILTYRFANTAFLLFKVKTAFIDIRDQGNRLGEIDMHRFIIRYFLIILVRVFDRAVFHTGGATRAFALDDISGLFKQGNPEVP